MQEICKKACRMQQNQGNDKKIICKNERRTAVIGRFVYVKTVIINIKTHFNI